MKNKREARTITGKDLGMKYGNLKVFINGSLRRRNKHLLKLTRERENEMEWDFAWTCNGVIFVKQNKDSESIVIRNELDIASKIV